MANRESKREDGIDFVSITTSINIYYAIAKAFLESGIPFVCDKPLTLELKDARHLASLEGEKDLLFGVTYTCTGYPMVKHARDLIRQGRIGMLRFISTEYPQDWLANPLDRTG